MNKIAGPEKIDYLLDEGEKKIGCLEWWRLIKSDKNEHEGRIEQVSE